MTHEAMHKHLAVLGAGKMGGILIEAFLKQGLVPAKNIAATVQHRDQERRKLSATAVSVGTDNRAAARAADIILLCVKPQTIGGVLDEIRSELTEKKLIVSIAASVPTEYIERRLGGNFPVIRAMPNTPSMVGAGITAICKGKFASDKDLDAARKLFDAVGRTVVVDEKHMDAVTGAFRERPGIHLHHFGSAGEGGVKMGLSRELATLLAAQTTLGAAKDGARDRAPSGAAERRGDDAGGLHD